MSMTAAEIARLMEGYIGSSQGYLNCFGSHPDVTAFLADCDLFVDVTSIPGTNKTRFKVILERAVPRDQARIIRGILKKCPVGSLPARSQERYDDMVRVASRLDGMAVPSPSVAITSEVVRRAIDDAESLIRSSGATSGVDRIHTALHGYTKEVCKRASIAMPDDPSITAVFKALRERHPKFLPSGPRSDDITRVIQAMAQIIDAMNPIRNNASMAHPKELLDEPEAMLVINAARTVLLFIDTKLEQ